MKISFVRGAYLNNYEGQNYDLPISGYSSLFPLDVHVPFPLVKLPSIADLQKVPLLKKPIKYIANRTLGDSQILFGLEKYIINSDIVHVGDPHYYYAYQAARLKEKGLIRKLVSTWWETIPFNNETTRAKKLIKNYVMSQVDMFLCYSEMARECLLHEGVTKDKIETIPLGVDLSRFRPTTQIKSKIFTILFVGRLVEEKGILDLYEAFKDFSSKNKNSRLLIVGNGPLKNELTSMIKKDNLQEKVSIEEKSYNEMPALFQKADVLCVPSKKTATWEEQYGMVFIEAMASGVPIISTKTGSIPSLVQNAGLLGESGDRGHIIRSLNSLYTDRQMSSKIGTIGRERAERLYDCKKTAQKIREMYIQL